MQSRDVHLQYRFGTSRQSGAAIDNPLFDLLSALADAGSIQKAAQCLAVSYRHLWGALKQWEDTIGEGLVHWERGQPARLTPFAERLLWSERQARVRMAPHIEALRHELQRVVADALDGSQQVLRIDASHDLALPGLQRLAQEHGLHLQMRFAGSFDALQSLADGRCVVAGFHVPQGVRRGDVYAKAMKPLLKPGRHKLLACMRREQGLIVRAHERQAPRSLAELHASGLRFADRDPGAGTHVLTTWLLGALGLLRSELNTSTTENSHLAVALAVAGGRADAAIGLRAAAANSALDFSPLVEEDYYLVCLSDALDTPAVRALRRMLALDGWARHLATLPGYKPSADAGQVRSLVQALPWWQLKPKRAKVAPSP
jgi:putative molybdopterin biosynthesis protein